MQRGAQGGRFAFVGRGALGRAAGASNPALALRNIKQTAAAPSASYSSQSSDSSSTPGFSSVDRDWFDWSKYRTTSSRHDPFYDLTTTNARWGMTDVWTQGMDPPQPIFPIDVKGRSKAYLPEVLSRKHFYMKYAMLNRPQQLHALNLSTIRQLTPVLKKWQAHKETTRAIVLTSSTPEHFSSGTDFLDLLQAVRSGNQEYPKTYFKELYQLIFYINSLDKPFLPIMNGVTMGSGASLGYSSNSFRITTEDAIFALPEAGMGFFPDAGASYTLSRLPDHIGTFLALTGKRIRGWDVLWSGLATNLVPADRLHIMYDQLDQLRDNFHSFEQIIHCVNSNEADRNEHPFLLKEKGYVNIIKRCFSQPTVPEIMKALSHEKNPWAQQVLNRLKEQCPLSLAVTLRSLQEGATKDMGSALRREYRIALRFMLTRDFAEGVTARIVEKRKPVWSHGSVEQVRPDEVQFFFESLREDELDIRSLDEERAEESAIQQLLDKQRRFKKMLRRPWVQDQVKQYLSQELKEVQQELQARQAAGAGGGEPSAGGQQEKESAAQRKKKMKKLEEGLAHKRDALDFLQRLEDELVRRRDTEKQAVTRMTVDKREWVRWEEDLKNVREAKGILTLDASAENDEQLPTAALQSVLAENLAKYAEAGDMDKQAKLVASALDTAGKSALELREHLFHRTNEAVSEAEAQDEARYKATLERDAMDRRFSEALESVDIEELKQSIADDLGLRPEEQNQLDSLLSGLGEALPNSARRQRRKQPARPEQEMDAKPLVTLDDVAQLLLGSGASPEQVAHTRAQMEKGEVIVGEETYAAAVQLMRERALAAAAPSEHATLEATFDTMKEEFTNVLKAKVAGKSQEEVVEALFGGEGKNKLGQLLAQQSAAAANGSSQDTRAALSDPDVGQLVLSEFRDFAKNIHSHVEEGKVPLWKLEDKVMDRLAAMDMEAVWSSEQRRDLGEQIMNDRQINDIIQSIGADPAEAREEERESRILDDALFEAEHGRPAGIPVDLVTDYQKEQFERAQSDMGLANYGQQFEYDKYADRIAHFRRIKERQAEFMEGVPDPSTQPEEYRNWLVAVRMGDLARPQLEEALERWIERKAAAGFNVKPVPGVLREDSVDGFVGEGGAQSIDEQAQIPAVFKLWEMATKASEQEGEEEEGEEVVGEEVVGEEEIEDSPTQQPTPTKRDASAAHQ